jgi:hypothetical protein
MFKNIVTVNQHDFEGRSIVEIDNKPVDIICAFADRLQKEKKGFGTRLMLHGLEALG